MAYGVADSLGTTQLLNILDLVYEFNHNPGEPKRAIFAMFGRYSPPKGLLPPTSPNKVSKFLHDNFVNVFQTQLSVLNTAKGHTVTDALRRTFIKLNEKLFHYLRDQSMKQRKNSRASSTATSNSWMYDPALQRTGASACVVYFVNKRMYAANVGNAMAVVSRQGEAHCLSKVHDPYDRDETRHIRAAGGWISTTGKVNEEVDVSRSFGHFNLVPTVNAKPHVSTWDVSPLDEFVIIANRGLWDFIPVQTAVDIARSAAAQDPMIAAQKLRDFAMSYGADGSTMIMVVMLSESRLQQEYARLPGKRKDRDELTPALKDLSRFRPEIDPPVGHLALVFTDIRNSTHLWEVNPGMPTAMRLHNSLLRKYLRICGGYEVKTEGDAFMVSFPTALEAVWWCLAVQKALLEEAWPLEILECEDGKEDFDERGTRIRRGLLVRMGIHSGYPVCEPDPITHRMDYFGSMVNRSARVNSAAGGQIAVTGDIVREINARVFETEPESEYSKAQPQMAVEGIKTVGVSVIPVGEMKLKGFEFTEHISHIYIKGLEARENFKDTPSTTTGQASRVQFSVPQTKELGMLCLRLEALSGGRLFRAFPDRKGSVQSATNGPMGDLVVDVNKETPSTVFMADPQLLLPPMTEDCSDVDLMLVLDSLSVRIENAIRGIAERICPPTVDKAKFMAALMDGGDLDPRTLELISSVLQKL
jgi:adenylate cyclase